MIQPEPPWSIILARQAETTLRRLPPASFRLLDRQISALAENPRPLECQRLVGYGNLYRLRVSEWRIAYAVEEERRLVFILEIVPKQQPERYRLDFEETEIKGEGTPEAETTNPEFLPPLDPNLTEEQTRQSLEEHFRLVALERLISSMVPGAIADLIIELERSKKAAAAQLEAGSQAQPDPSTLAGREKIRLFIRVNALPLRPDLYKMIETEPDLEFVGDAGEADVILTETTMPKGVFSPNTLVESTEAEPAVASPELWIRPEQTLLLIQDLANYLASPAGLRDYLKVPFSKEALLGAVHRIYRQSQAQDTMSAALRSLKTLKLGSWIELSLSVANLSASLPFYEKLGLKPLDRGEYPYPWAVVSDETLHLGLHQRSFLSPTLSYFSWGDDISRRVAILKKFGILLNGAITQDVVQWPLTGSSIIAAEFQTFEGQRIYLTDFRQERPERSFFARPKHNKFGELSLKTNDITAAVGYWAQFGFECTARSDKPYPWATLSDGLIRLGLHQTSRFTHPTISYFSPNMPDRLQHLREQDVPFLSEYKDVQGRTIGAVVRSPDGQPFFLFTGQPS